MNLFKKIHHNFFPSKDPKVLTNKYGIPKTINLHWDTRDGYFVVTSPEMPGLITEARSHQDLIEMVNDAVLSYYDVPETDAKIIGATLNLQGYGTITLDGRAPA